MSEIEVNVTDKDGEALHRFGITRDDIIEVLEQESDDGNAVEQAADAVLEALANLDLGELAKWLVEQTDIEVSDYEDEDDDDEDDEDDEDEDDEDDEDREHQNWLDDGASGGGSINNGGW